QLQSNVSYLEDTIFADLVGMSCNVRPIRAVAGESERVFSDVNIRSFGNRTIHLVISQQWRE
ncbi:hypothetical protein, partial [Flavobacterium agri]|uniref:hypothetical protein n=1 Tax=Flavobacterium agri TaxID=2743471 RepID=UPI001C378654